MKLPPRIQYLLIAALALAAIALAIPALHDSNTARILRGDCGPLQWMGNSLRVGRGAAGFNCPPLKP
jgi:hypothetical protein